MENTKEVELKLDEYLKLIHIITEENTTINDILQYMIDADAVVIGENRLKFATLFFRTIQDFMNILNVYCKEKLFLYLLQEKLLALSKYLNLA